MSTVLETVVNAYRSFRSHRILYATLHVCVLAWFLLPIVTSLSIGVPNFCHPPGPITTAQEASESGLSQDTDYVAVYVEKERSCEDEFFEAGSRGTVSGVTVSGNESNLRVSGHGLSTTQEPREIETTEQLFGWGHEGEITMESQTWRPIAGWPFLEKEYDVGFKEPVTYDHGGRTVTVIDGYVFEKKQMNLWMLPILGLVALNSVYQICRWVLFRIRRRR